MVFTLLVVSALAILSMAVLEVGRGVSREIETSAENRGSFFLAEAGIAEAVAARRAGGTGNVASADLPAYLDGGVLWVEAEDLGNGRTRLVSNAMKGEGRSSVEVILGSTNVWARLPGVTSLEEPILKSDNFLDSYDSRKGTYADQLGAETHAGEGNTLQSNAGLDLGSGMAVYGNAHVGDGHSLSMGAGSFVTGSTAPLTAPLEMAPVTAPSVAVGGSYTASGTVTLPPGTYGFSGMTVEKDAVFTIQGPATIVIDGDLDVDRADLIIDPDGEPVQIYLTGDLLTSTKATITTLGAEPANLQVYLTGDADQKAYFHPHGEFHGTIYGPLALVDVGTGFEVFGAVAARKVELQPHVRIHFDEALLEEEGGGTSSEQVLHWSPTERSSIPNGAKRGDPFHLLGVDRDDLPSPGEAWDGVDEVAPEGGSDGDPETGSDDGGKKKK